MKLKANEVLVLRNVREDMTSYNGFKWPKKGFVEAPDFINNHACGNGLHGLLWGVGSTIYFYTDPCKWLVIKVNKYNNLKDKIKFQSGRVIFCGTREKAVELIAKHAPANSEINFLTQISEGKTVQVAGYGSTQIAGNRSIQKARSKSTQKAGYGSTQKAGYESTQTAGDGSTQTAGDESTQTAGDWSIQTAGDGSTQKAGDGSTQTAGDWSIQTAGPRSTQKAGYESTQKAGYESTQTAGNWSTQKAGNKSVQIIHFYNKVFTRTITEKEANRWYKFEDDDWRLCTKEEIEEAERKTKEIKS